tara:strand:- start:4029 stop:4508 length:480 start_codon:yes stop_codon:yes gene_type:complete
MIRFYRANPSSTGCCGTFYVNGQGNIMMKFVKQAGYDGRAGDFKSNSKNPEKNAIVKLSRVEAGGIIDCIENNVDYSFDHFSDTQTTSVKFGNANQDDSGLPKNYSIAVFKTIKDSKKKVNFSMYLERGEARLLIEELKRFIYETALVTGYSSQDQNAR